MGHGRIIIAIALLALAATAWASAGVLAQTNPGKGGVVQAEAGTNGSASAVAAAGAMPGRFAELPLSDPAQAEFFRSLQSELRLPEGMNFTGEAEADDYLMRRTLIVEGGGMSGAEKAAYAGMLAANPGMQNATRAPDSEDTAAKVRGGGYLLAVLVGGPSQNSVTKAALAEGWLNKGNASYPGFMLSYGKTGNGTVVVAISDPRGYGNVAREGAKYSPLAAVIPVEYVPAAATGISAILLALISIGRTIFEFKALDVGRKGQTVGEHAIMVAGVNIGEGLAIIVASLVLGLSISWQYFGPTPDFIFWAVVNTFICLGAAILHEVSHRALAAAFGFRVEYRIWPAGSALTLISSWLGNAFSVQGFLLEEIPEGAAKWKVALMRIIGPLVSAATMVFFALVNVFFPHTLFQMIYSTSALWAIAEVFPFSGLDGKDLKDWNVFVWLFTFCLVAAAYVAVTFVI